MTLPLIVGVDGSDASFSAADWAAREAEATGRAVRLVYVRPTGSSLRFADVQVGDEERHVLQAMTQLAVDLRRDHPGIRVDTESLIGPVDLQLLRSAEEGGTLVLGTRGSGGFVALLLGSVAQSVAARAESPVVLVPRRDAAVEPADRIVVGVDPTGDCRPVLEFALRSAQDQGVALRAVHVWQPPALWAAGPEQRRAYRHRELELHHARVLREAVADVRTDFPAVEVTSVELSGSPAKALVEEADKAWMLVVGRRRHRSVSALGPVVHAAVHHARCPVAVVPHW
jgi:nucleotide-binding universal stress UspA family protein